VQAILMLAAFFGQVVSSDSNPPLRVVGDETLLIKVKADPRDYLGRSFVMTGGIKVASYHNYGYLYAEKSHYSLSFIEVVDNEGNQGERRCHLYLARNNLSKNIIDHIIKKTEQNDYVRIRIKVTLDPNRYEDGAWNLLELLDVQFSQNDGKWGDWVVQKAIKTAQQDRERTRLAAMEAEKLAKENNAKMEEDKRSARTRKWSDVSGKFSVVAEYKGIIAGKVRLKKEDGDIISVPIEVLCEEDRDWLQSDK